MPDIIPAPLHQTSLNPPTSRTAAGPQQQDPRERKEERRRERRERRERRQRQRQTELSNHLDAYIYEGNGGNTGNLPDLVNHQPPPPYATLPPGGSTSLLCPSGGQQPRGGGWRASISSFSRR